MKSKVTLALLLCLPAGLAADWEEELRQELRQAGYSKKQIEEAVEAERRAKKSGPSEPDFVLPPDQIKREPKGPSADFEEELRKRLKDLGFEGKSLDRKVAYFARMSKDKREQKLKEMEGELELELWIEEMLEPVREKLEENDWPAGELDDRLDEETGFLKDVRPLYEQAEEDAGEDKEPEVDEKKLGKKRGKFEEKLAEEYVEQARKKLREEWSDEVIEELIEAYEDYVDEPFDERKSIINKLARNIRAEILAKREKEFAAAAKVILQDMKVVWAEISLPPGDRRTRKKDVALMCEDLAACETEKQFKKIFEQRIKELRKSGYHKDELELIQDELERMAP